MNSEKHKVVNAAPAIPTKCVIGLDRDGVINRDLGTYVTRSSDFEHIEGSLEAIAKIRRLGHRIVIITNQGGIENGIMTAENVDNVHSHMLELFGQAGCPSIDAIYYSESSRKNDMYAKPNAGMFKRCAREHSNIKWSQGFFIGDKMSDLKAAMKVGARPVLVRTGYGLETEKQLNKYTYKDIKRKTYVFDSLADFADQL
jgi:D-glycero-D-manno-heptose 1,7-bisphosphate phosphatase